MTVIHTPARRLVEAFGDCSALEAMYTEDVLFAKATDGMIHEVVELLDTHASNEQHQGKAVGVPPTACSL